ncbi:MAG: LysR family transcriptional regulator [Clostridiales bacterium]|nr:LysR family transcriptional regulator [Clostridiales bacterium]
MSQREYLRISTLQMHYFIEVASCGSFTSASQHLYTTQSTLSKTISALEKNLDVQLFIRSHKRLYLTEAGRHLYEKWKKILSELEHSVEESRILQGGHADYQSAGKKRISGCL